MTDDYDPEANLAGCYAYAIRQCRLKRIRSGEIDPDMTDGEERSAWRQHQISAGMKAYWKRRRAAVE